MTQEEKQLLLKDLCARLPYGVKLYHEDDLGDNIGKLESININDGECVIWNYNGTDTDIFDIEDVKPFLRPLSSMTEEEKLKLVTLYLARDGRCRKDLRIKETELFLNSCWYVQITYNDENDKEVISTVYIGRCSYIEETDWLNKYHFDYRGLIEKGLALQAPEGMYNFK